MKLRPQYALVCDHVRREDSGKLILIGVYGRNIVLPHVPYRIVLSFVANLIADEPGQEEVEFQCLLDGEMLGGIKGPVQMEHSGASLLSAALPIELKKPGTLEYQWRQLPNEKWESIFSIPVEVREAN